MIQPLDIKSQRFKKGLLGYKTSDVDNFVNTVYRAYEDIFKENEKLSSDMEKLNASLQEGRLKIFDLENQLNSVENVESIGGDSAAKKKADDIIKNAEAAAADIIAKAKEQAKKFESGEAVIKEEPAVDEPSKENSSGTTFKIKGQAPKRDVKPVEEPKESASAKFFKKTDEQPAPAKKIEEEDDDEIFVGEIEDARKPDRMMIGDGEEEEDLDFEFL
ncbi:MAG: DivIVA domain-containing protein [Lachnospiraceae bacterium]|nr:DivIVA domain-containing protein [Lachnospiraceae bacterium]